MHLAEGILPLTHATGWSALALPMVVWSIRGEQQLQRDDATSPAVISGVTCLLFAATLLPLPVPVVGATSHICLTPVLALIVGIRRILWPTFFVLLLQAVFFAHGGLTTLGVNTLILGWLGPVVTLGLWKALKKLGVREVLALAIACGVGGFSVYVADALVLATALADVASPKATFIGVLLGFAPVQLPLAILEGFVSVGIIRLLATRRPGLLPESLRTLGTASKLTGAFSIVLVAIGASGCSYQPIDETVFGAAAHLAGRPPTDSLVDLSQGETGFALSIIILFGIGFIAGRSWERMFGGGRDALPR